MKTIKTTCPYCGVGCGIQAQANPITHGLTIAGDPLHPANFGKLCSKGLALGDTVGLEGRLLTPKIKGLESDWDSALQQVANTFLDIMAHHGPDAVAFYGSGQLLTEDYYVANKLMKGFIGSANIDTNSRLCMSSSVAGHKRAFGSDTVPGCYADFELAEMIILVGSNAAWCHPVIYQRIRAAKTANPLLKIIVIDPRKTSSCDIADLHLPIASGGDALLFNGLLHYLQQNQVLDQAFIAAHTQGFDEALAYAATYDLEAVAAQCGLAVGDILGFYEGFTKTEKVMTCYSQGINQSSSGTDKVNAIINCHLATGKIGKPGMGPFSLTGQPNAMGGREVGGLSHQLAAHMDFSSPEDIARVARFWGSPKIAAKPGYSAVELFDAIYDGKVKAVWIMGTNPVVSLPNADKVKAALSQCPFVVVSDCIAKTDTTAYADVLLPAAGWSEKDGTVTNSERRISRQRALFAPSGDAKPDWWIITEVAKRMGFQDAFPYQSPVDIFKEHAALSGFENTARHGLRDFDISAFADLAKDDYDHLLPIQWPVNQAFPEGRARLFADGQFFTATGKAQFIAVQPRPPVNLPDTQYPYRLNTGRLRDQWHTMTRTALSAKLNRHKPEPFVEIHPADAKPLGLKTGGLAIIESAWGGMIARVQVTDSQLPGNLFVPMHWTGQLSSHGRMGALVNPVLDPLSKQPESKHTPVRIKAYRPAWQGVILSRTEMTVTEADYWVKINGDGFFRYELAGANTPENWPDWAKQIVGHKPSAPAHWQDYQDAHLGRYRAASFNGDTLASIIYIDKGYDGSEHGWLASLFAKTALTLPERKALLIGRLPSGMADTGPTICSCFNVGQTAIRNAIKEHRCKTAEDIGHRLKAGTNCGSCVPEIKALLRGG